MNREKALSIVWWSLLAVALAVTAWTVSLSYRSIDYLSFLRHWVDFIRENGYFHALTHGFADYNVLYLYLLTLVAYIPGEPLVPIKILSIMFQGVLGIYMGRIIHLRYRAPWTLPAGLALAFLLPTALLNSAYWAQCDALYTSMLLASLYYIMTRRPALSMLFLGIAFSFKLQTVFILPMFFVLLLTGNMRWRYVLIPFIVHFAVLLPAWLLGRPLPELLGIYLSQSGSYSGRWMLLCSNLYTMACGYHLIPTDGSAIPLWTAVALLMVLGGCLLCAWVIYRKNFRVDTGVILYMALLSTAIVPWMLPSMHERYLFPADVLAVVCMFRWPRLWPALVALPVVSLICYFNFFWCRYVFDYLFNPSFEAAGFLYAAAVIALILYPCLTFSKRKSRLSSRDF